MHSRSEPFKPQHVSPQISDTYRCSRSAERLLSLLLFASPTVHAPCKKSSQERTCGTYTWASKSTASSAKRPDSVTKMATFSNLTSLGGDTERDDGRSKGSGSRDKVGENARACRPYKLVEGGRAVCSLVSRSGQLAVFVSTTHFTLYGIPLNTSPWPGSLLSCSCKRASALLNSWECDPVSV